MQKFNFLSNTVLWCVCVREQNQGMDSKRKSRVKEEEKQIDEGSGAKRAGRS